MKALAHEDGPVVVDVPEPVCGAEEALVAVRMAGICATDLEVTRGYRAFRGLMGHEMVGEVVECVADPSWVGQRVAAEINVTCGLCDMCARGRGNHCRKRTVMGIHARPGCFAERVALPVRNLHRVPEHVPDQAAVFTEPLAAAYAITTQVDVAAMSSIAVLGDGRLGLLIAMALHECGGDVTLIGRHPHKLAIAEAVGVRVQTVDATDGESFELVVEATGSHGGLARALELVAARGTVVLKSTMHRAPTVDTNRIVVDEIRLLGSRCGPFPTALAALGSGAVDPAPLVDATYPLDRGVEAVAHAARKGTLKILLNI